MYVDDLRWCNFSPRARLLRDEIDGRMESVLIRGVIDPAIAERVSKINFINVPEYTQCTQDDLSICDQFFLNATLDNS